MKPFQTGICILVLDSDRSSAERTNALLASCQYKVIIAERATEALSMVSESRCKIDIVLTEFDLPDMDGLAFIETVLQIRRLPVIVLSTFVNNGTKVQCMLKGAKFCYDKPLHDYPAKNLWQICVLKRDPFANLTVETGKELVADNCSMVPMKREMCWSPELHENQQISLLTLNLEQNVARTCGNNGGIKKKILPRGRMPSSNFMNAYKKK